MSVHPAILGAVQGERDTGGGTGPGWPDPFMSYPLSGPITLTAADNGTTISNLSFENLTWPQRPITLDGCDNITIERVDSRRCSMGIVFASYSTNITIRYCRAENITGPYERPGGENRANMYQLAWCDTFTCHDIKGRYGDTEDAYSHFASNNGTVYNLQWEGARTSSQPTTDGGPSIPWRSNSGTGCIIGDGDGDDVDVFDSTFINPGQVGIAVAGGTNGSYTNCVVVSDGGRESDGWENVGAYTINYYSVCDSNTLENNRVYFANTNHFFDGGSCSNTSFINNTWGDGSLNIEDYRVVL